MVHKNSGKTKLSKSHCARCQVSEGTGLVNNFVELNARNKIGVVEIKRNFRNKMGSQKVYSEVTLYPPPSTLPRFFPTFAKIFDPQKKHRADVIFKTRDSDAPWDRDRHVTAIHAFLHLRPGPVRHTDTRRLCS